MVFFLYNQIKLLVMKTYTEIIKRSLMAVVSLFVTALAMAQDKVDVDINAKDSSWYASPWVWIVGAAVFILLLVALARGGNRSDA
jgi:hypothetical protein